MILKRGGGSRRFRLEAVRGQIRDTFGGQKPRIC